MRILLDTHIAIWSLTAPENLSVAAQALIAGEGNTIYVSAATIWEIAIKYPLERKTAPPFSAAEALDAFQQAGFVLLDITAAHAAAVESLPKLHGDPFDRLLIAQAIEEPVRLLTHDRHVAAYDSQIILV